MIALFFDGLLNLLLHFGSRSTASSRIAKDEGVIELDLFDEIAR